MTMLPFPGRPRRPAQAVVYKEIRISCAHMIPNHPGKCARLHGHNYTIVVGVEGEIQPSTGMVKDFYEISYDLKKVIDEPCDHQYLNDIYPDMLTTAENLARHWLTQLFERDARYSTIRVFETDTSFVDTDVYMLGLKELEEGLDEE